MRSLAFADNVSFWFLTLILTVSWLKPAISAMMVMEFWSWNMSVRGLGSFHFPLLRRLGRRYFCGCMREVLKFSNLGVLGVFLGFMLMSLRSSHFRCFLLLRHFALMLFPPDTEGIYSDIIKCIAQKG